MIEKAESDAKKFECEECSKLCWVVLHVYWGAASILLDPWSPTLKHFWISHWGKPQVWYLEQKKGSLWKYFIRVAKLKFGIDHFFKTLTGDKSIFLQLLMKNNPSLYVTHDHWKNGIEVMSVCDFATCLCHIKPINILHINVNISVAPRLPIFIQSIVGSKLKMFVIKVAGHKNLDAYCRVAKTCQPCQPAGANFSRPVLIFGQSTQKTMPICPMLISLYHSTLYH